MLATAAFADAEPAWPPLSAAVRALPALVAEAVEVNGDGARRAATVSAAAPAVTTAIAEFLVLRCVRGRACLAMADPAFPIALPKPPVRCVGRIESATLWLRGHFSNRRELALTRYALLSPFVVGKPRHSSGARGVGNGGELRTGLSTKPG